MADRYSPKEDVFEVQAIGGESFKFRAVKSIAEINSIKRGVQAFTKQIKSKSVPPDWVPYLTDDEITLSAVHCISTLSVGWVDAAGVEHGALSALDCLILAQGAWPLFEILQNGIDSNQYKTELLEEAAAIAEKKSASRQTSDSETA